MNKEGPISLLQSAGKLFLNRLNSLLSLGFIIFAVSLIQLFAVETNSKILFALSVGAGIIVTYIVYLAMIRVVSNPVEMSVTEAFNSIEKYIMPAVIVSSIVLLIVIGGSILFVVPGVIVSIFTAFALYALVVDHYEKKEAIIYSWSLVKGRWWSVLWKLVLANIMIGLAGYIISSIFWSLGIGEPSWQTVQRLSAGGSGVPFSQSLLNYGINNFFTLPLAISFMYVLYESLKRTSPHVLSDVEKLKIKYYIKVLSIVAVSILIASIFISSIVIAKFLPEFIKLTHSPASALSSF